MSIYETYLETKGYFYTLNNGVLRVSIDDKQKCKKEIVKFIYENDYELDLLKRGYDFSRRTISAVSGGK